MLLTRWSHGHMLQPGEQQQDEAASGPFTHPCGSLMSSFVMLFPLTTQNSRVPTNRKIACISMRGILFFHSIQLSQPLCIDAVYPTKAQFLQMGHCWKGERTWWPVTPRKHQPSTASLKSFQHISSYKIHCDMWYILLFTIHLFDSATATKCFTAGLWCMRGFL